jgi:iron(III) transport system ATP-binding protein
MWLELDRVSRSFRATRALDDVSFALAEGEIGCLLGPSGCGKTTALRCIAGFEPVDAGRVLSRGQVHSAPGFVMPPYERHVGLVFQEHALFPHLTALANVEFGLHRLPAAQRRQQALRMLGMVGLADAAASYPAQLSGGQQQRVALARALAPQPATLLLDEPFASLDLALRERLVPELRELLKRLGTTALIVTHDQQDAFALADRIGLLRSGRLEQWASPYELYHRPVSRFAAEFVGQVSFVPVERRDGVLRTELGPLPVANGQAHDGASDILLRPDDVVHDDDAPLRARIIERVFRGAEYLYTLELPSGRRVLSLVPSHHDLAIGEHIGVRLATDHVVTFPASAGS